ncbi:SRPBCC family protein [Pseudaminobacter sp. NGMCC 1.201702]|uniref:SRPBCC family protein n=1 Tax=Pseudaminobacter sp. NGMCC 1.201702 TaxID=3391825 RepID=UPI0039F13FF6
MPQLAYSAEATVPVDAPAEALFGYLDNHGKLSAHMDQPSWAMMGAKMEVHMDASGTQSVGSTFGFTGSFVRMPLAVDEIITERKPPFLKTWTTIGEPRLWVIGRYRMGLRIAPRSGSSLLTVFIGYDLPQGFGTRMLGWLLGGIYARWCTRRMAGDAARHFRKSDHRCRTQAPGRQSRGEQQ